MFEGNIYPCRCENSRKCDLCQMKFTTKGNLNKHVISVHEKNYRPNPCRVCQKSFKKRTLLTLHIREEHDLNEFQCHICRMEFNHQTNLHGHIKGNFFP